MRMVIFTIRNFTLVISQRQRTPPSELMLQSIIRLLAAAENRAQNDLRP